MAPKRKRKPNNYSSSVNAKRARNQSAVDTSSDGIAAEYYKARGIVAENRARYLIDWEDDPTTGEKYSPTWEPKANANEEAVFDWQSRKQQRQVSVTGERTSTGQKTGTPAATGSSSKESSNSHPKAPAPYNSSRGRRGITTLPSSSEADQSQRVFIDLSADDSRSADRQADSSNHDRTITVLKIPTSSLSSLLQGRKQSEPKSGSDIDVSGPRNILAHIEISRRGSFDPNDYSPHFWTPSQSEPATSQDQLSIFNASQDSQGRFGRNVISISSDPQTLAADSLSLLGTSSFDPSSLSQAHTTATNRELDLSSISERHYAAFSQSAPAFGVLPQSDPIEDNSSPPPGQRNRPDQHLSKSSPYRIDSSVSSPPSASPVQLFAGDQVPPLNDSSGTRSFPGQSQVSNVQKNSSDKEEAVHDSSELFHSAQLPSSLDRAQFHEEIPETQLSTAPSSRRSSLAHALNEAPSGTQESSRSVSLERTDPSHEAFQTQVPFFHDTQASGQRDRTASPESSLSWKLAGSNTSSAEHSNRLSLALNGPLQSGQVLAVPNVSDSQNTAAHELAFHSQSSNKSSALSERSSNSVKQPPSFKSKSALLESSRDGFTSAHRQTAEQDSVIESIENTEPVQELGEEALGEGAFGVGGEQSSSLGNIPTPPKIPESVRMAEPQGSGATPMGSSLKEKLRHLRASSATGRNADGSSQIASPGARPLRTTKSPSAIPEAAQSTTASAAPQTALRYQVPRPSVEINEPTQVDVRTAPTQSSVPDVISPQPEARPPRQGREEFLLGLPMNARVRDQYQQIIYNYRDDIEAFIHADGAPALALVDKMTGLISQVKNVTLHPDLENEGTLTQQNVHEREEAKWAEYSSGKFLFLRHLFDELRSDDANIAIVAQPGRMLDIIETFLKGNRVVFSRPDQGRRSDGTAEGSMTVTLLPTGEAGSGLIVSSATVVIAFDTSFSAEDRQVQSLRTHMFNVGELAPVISLIVNNSVEHIELCLPPSLDETQRMQALVSCIAQTRHEVGELGMGMPHPEAAAKLVAVYVGLKGHEEVPWPLAQLGGIAALDALLDAPEATQATTADVQATQSASDSAPQKRPLPSEDDHEEAPGKKLRLTPEPGTIASNSQIEVTHISDSVTQPSTGPVQSSTTTTGSETGPFRTQVEALEKQLQAQIDLEKELRAIIAKAETRVDDHVQALSELQLRYEDRDEEIRSARKERDAAIAAKEQIERRRGLQAEEIAKLKESRMQVQKELEEARTSLSTSTLPEVAELEKARAEARQAQAEKTRLEHRLASTTKDFEFTRQQYQAASNAAAESANELQELRDENVTLRRQASGEAAKLREMNAASGESAHASRIQHLELLLEDREEQLRRKDEELKAHLRGRGLATRASSVPRSPRPYSRPSSPVPPPVVRVQHPLRNG